MRLVADCASCVGLCCVAPALVASADFALTKPAGRPCVHLSSGSRCGIHASLIERGFPGCVAYDCFGAGQRAVSLLGPERTPQLLHAYEVLHQLHELLFYLSDALSRPLAGPLHPALTDLRDAIAALDPATADPAAHRSLVAPLLRRASALVRTGPTPRRPAPAQPAAEPGPPGADPPGANPPGADLARVDPAGADLGRVDPAGADLGRVDPAGADLGRVGPAERDPAGVERGRRDLAGADLVGRDLAGADLSRADLSTAYLLGTSLRGADLRTADFLGADLRGADLRGADLTGALYLTRTQIGAARGDARTVLPPTLDRPSHWGT